MSPSKFKGKHVFFFLAELHHMTYPELVITYFGHYETCSESEVLLLVA